MVTDTKEAWVYVGTYTHPMPFVQGKAAGIKVCRLDYASGALSPVRSVTGVTNPSYLTVDPRHCYLYCVEEYAVGVKETGEVSAFRIDAATGALAHLNRQPSHGAEPAHISVDRDGRWVLVANYRSGSIAVMPIREDGSLGPATDVVQHAGQSLHSVRQRGPHAHWIHTDPANRFVLVADLGLDAILTYRLDQEQGKLEPAAVARVEAPRGSGPRHLAFRPDGRFVYLVNELDSSIVAYAYDDTEGHLTQVQHISTLPSGYPADTSSIAAVRVAPDGRFVYASNRGHNSIAVFASDVSSGKLEYLGFEPSGGLTPRDFIIDPTGSFLLAANQDSNTVVTFRVEKQSGKLVATDKVTTVETPVCLEFCPVG